MPRLPVRSKRFPSTGVNKTQATELLLQALEGELAGVQVYESAILLAVDPDLRREWASHLEQTRNHVRILRGASSAIGLDPQLESPGRAIVRELGHALVQAMASAQHEGPEEAAQRVATECVALAATKDHLAWELIGSLAQTLQGSEAALLRDAHREVAGETEEHLHRTLGWARELWRKSLGVPAVLPPPATRREVRVVRGDAVAKEERAIFLKRLLQ
jgi:rubrerythrin